jgi:hypothetical protein
VTSRRLPVSIVCVFNDPDVRRDCLDRSVQQHRHEVADLEYIPVDNVTGAFASAGAALNHGAAQARHDYVAFVHQDVHLHSLAALEEAAGVLATGDFGLLGAVGIRSDGRLVGRVRDRVVLLGDRAVQPTDVDSLDEVLFLAPRELIRRHPLSESPELAWHAYTVEYGLRVRSLGLRVGAADLPLTHNSMTTNLARLDVAHRAVAARHPDVLPVATTCGTIARPGSHPAQRPELRPLRGLYRRLRESARARPLRQAAGTEACVLSDIRRDLDDVLASTADHPVSVVNRDDDRDPPWREHLELTRRGRRIMVTARATDELRAAVADRLAAGSVLVTNLDPSTAAALLRGSGGAARLTGWYSEIGGWVLLGPAAVGRSAQWDAAQYRTVRVPALSRS